MALSKDTEAALQQLHQSPAHWEYFSGAVRECINYPQGLQYSILSALEGIAFESLYHYPLRGRLRELLPNICPENGTFVLLAPHETYQLYLKYHPYLVGISVPDGLLLEDTGNRWVFSAICEAKSGISYSRPGQLRAYLHPNCLRKDFGLNHLRDSAALGEAIHTIKEDFPPKPVFATIQTPLICAVPQSSQIHLPLGETVEIPIPYSDLGTIAHAAFLRLRPREQAKGLVSSATSQGQHAAAWVSV